MPFQFDYGGCEPVVFWLCLVPFFMIIGFTTLCAIGAYLDSPVKLSFQFSLRSMMLLVTVISVGLAISRSGDPYLTAAGLFVAFAVVQPWLVQLPPRWRWLRIVLVLVGIVALAQSIGWHMTNPYIDE